MSEYELIPEDTYASLPDDAHEKFAVLVRVAQSNLVRLLDHGDSRDFANEIRSQFISVITGVAEALDIDGLPKIDGDISDYSTYTTFQVFLAGLVARVRLSPHIVARPYSVGLGRITKAKIQQEIDQLRRSIDDSELPDEKRAALRDKLDDLEQELSKQRLSFARTMAIAASIMTIAGGATAAVANMPRAVETVMIVMRLIGEDKEKEEAERLRLAPPQRALPDLTSAAVKPKYRDFIDDLDDDVPF